MKIKSLLGKIQSTIVIMVIMPFFLIPFMFVVIICGIWTGKLNSKSTVGDVFNYIAHGE